MGFIYTPLLQPQTRTPTVTLVGGAGNTVPQYTTITSRWQRIGPNLVIEDFFFTGDGGNEGAGTGRFNISLNFTTAATQLDQPVMFGFAHNNVADYIVFGTIAPGSSTVQLSYFTLIAASGNFTGAEQNNANRYLRGRVIYEI